MSKALRIATEEMQNNIPLLSAWHPFHMDSSGNSPPCFLEFMKLMDCVRESKAQSCYSDYSKLLSCLSKHGFDEN